MESYPGPIDGSAAQYNAERSLPDDGGNFSRSLQIDMKSLVGDAVGNVRTSLAGAQEVMDSAVWHEVNQGGLTT
jgi:hypothetical protein